MNEYPGEIWFLEHRLEEAGDGRSQVLVEPLLFPELASLGESAAALRRVQLGLAKEVADAGELSVWHQRFLPAAPELAGVTLRVPPQEISEAWPEPVTLDISYAWWRHGGPEPGARATHWVAWVPALKIGVVTAREEDLAERVRQDALSAIRRAGHNESLDRLALLARARTTLHRTPWNPWPDTPKERWLREETSGASGEDPLTELTAPMDPEFCTPGFEMGPLLARMARVLGAEDRPSLLLAGPAGVGKSAAVQELVRQRTSLGLGRRRIHRTSGAMLVAGACGYGMWQQRCQDLIAAARGAEVILYAGNLFELANTGQSAHSTQSIASFFRGAMERGEVQLIVECTPEQLALLERQDPRLTESLRILQVDAPDATTAGRIFTEFSLGLGGLHGPRFTAEALRQADLLHRRYASLSSFPGRPLRFLRQVSEGVPRERMVESADVFAAFSTMSGMPRELLDPALPLDLNAAETWFSGRVRGQADAVRAMVEMLARTKAGMNRPVRPLASFLFAGPTGTGKTESARALAHWLFRSPDRMVRIDASEYSKPWSAARLVSGSRGGREGVLTAAVREQPFSVVLIDEFEKADGAVFDLLLQVLGEARLTDAAGRTADFSNCVIILTSNLGADNFGRSALGFRGQESADGGAAEHFTEAVKRAVRPEFFNRIDRIVAFQPLPPDIVRDLTRREIDAAAARPGLAGADISLSVPDGIVAGLAAAGWDPRYGARPLKRIVARRILAPVADILCEGVAPRSAVTVEPGRGELLKITVRGPQQRSGEAEMQRSLTAALRTAGFMRRRCEWLEKHSVALGLRSRSRNLEQQIATAKRQRRSARETAERVEEQRRLTVMLERLSGMSQACAAHEETLLLQHCAGSLAVPPGAPVTGGEWESLFLTMLAEAAPAGGIVMIFQAHSGDMLEEAVKRYADLVREAGGQVVPAFYSRKPAADKWVRRKDQPDSVAPEIPEKREEQQQALERHPAGTAAVALWISGGLACLLMQREGGIHTAEEEHKQTEGKAAKGRAASRERFRFTLSVRPASDFSSRTDLCLDYAALLRPDLLQGTLRRHYDFARSVVRDGVSGQKVEGGWRPAWLSGELRRLVLEEAGWTPETERSLT